MSGIESSGLSRATVQALIDASGGSTLDPLGKAWFSAQGLLPATTFLESLNDFPDPPVAFYTGGGSRTLNRSRPAESVTYRMPGSTDLLFMSRRSNASRVPPPNPPRSTPAQRRTFHPRPTPFHPCAVTSCRAPG